MIVFYDRLSGDELFTDTFKYTITTTENPGTVGPGLYRIECELKTEKDGENFDTGANASAEEAGEDSEALSKTGLDVALASNLAKAEINKAGYKAAIKDYMKNLKEHLQKNNPEVVDSFVDNAKKVVGAVIGKNFGQFEFYQGESLDPDGMLAICCWEQDDTVPVLYYFQEGVRAEKV